MEHSKPVTRFGTIALAGRPNAGKSTLLNALVGQKLAIVSPKPQTTRHAVSGILTRGDTQLVFLDPPGLLDPAYLLQTAMVAEAARAVRRADAILYLHPWDEGPPPPLAELLPPETRVEAPVALVRTKADLVSERRLVPRDDAPTFIVSAKTGEGLEPLLAWCGDQARPGPFRYPPEETSTQPVRFFVGEFIREAAFERLGEEVPYAVAVTVDEFREQSDPVYIRANVFVERPSQKRIVIGHAGRTIREIGTRARLASEELLGRKVYLDLRVKVLRNWRRSPGALRRLGLLPPPSRSP